MIKHTKLLLFIFIIALGVFFFVNTEIANASEIIDGDLIKEPNSPDIYIVKIIEDPLSSGNIKKFRRLILNPEIFNSYGHLRWDDVKDVPTETLNTFVLSDLVIEVNSDGTVADPNIYKISSKENSDVGQRQWLNLSSVEFEYMGFDWGAVYKINHTEASPDFYPESEAITYDPAVYSREYFTVYRNEDNEKVLEKLHLEGYISNKTSFASKLPYVVQPGGYVLNQNMPEDEVASILNSEPFMIWISIPEGYRKEQIGNLMTSRLGWSEIQSEAWAGAYQKLTYKSYEDPENYKEGVYFPDTYLIPRTEGPIQVTQRMINNFNKRFAPYVEAFPAEHNMGWQDALTLASIVQREASGFEDAKLVAGILWNRIEKDMAFQVDATIQYAVNSSETGWWAPISSSDRNVDSPFNTYMYKGLPPHPISNPGLISIDAVLDPQETDCIFFIHAKGEIYCSATYQGHLDNIRKYL